MGMAAEEIPAVHVTDGQGITVEPVSHLEVTLVVGTPDLVRSPWNGPGTSGMFSPKSSFAASDEALPFQDIRCRGYCRSIRVMGSKDLEELLRPPRGMFHPC